MNMKLTPPIIALILIIVIIVAIVVIFYSFTNSSSNIPITIYNTQSIPTPAPFQQDIAICNGNINIGNNFAYINNATLFNEINPNGKMFILQQLIIVFQIYIHGMKVN